MFKIPHYTTISLSQQNKSYTNVSTTNYLTTKALESLMYLFLISQITSKGVWNVDSVVTD